VPLFDRNRLWGNVELRFGELYGHTLVGFMRTEVFRLMVFSILVGFFVYLVFMLRTLRQVDPSAVIPDRVNAAFDTLSEGVMIIDESEQILLTNKAFSERIGRDPAMMMSTRASDMKWKKVSRRKADANLPWVEALASGSPVIGAQFDLVTESGETIKYAINASPILNPDGTTQGVLVTLDDITKVEEQNVQLKTMVDRLEETQAMVQEQNKELSYLATRDALTGCLNRRAFTDGFKLMFDESREEGTELSCIMIDLDHFKAVNDNFGHVVGDEVLVEVAKRLDVRVRAGEVAVRFGGDEFAIILPNTSVEGAEVLARDLEQIISLVDLPRTDVFPHRVSASAGAADLKRGFGPKELIRAADIGLYARKKAHKVAVVSAG
jgi:diguanylate cyclase (GGDEF)-like protein/PAS domain S-box-containing protein